MVNDEGISIGWPGWRLIQEGDVVGENGIVDIWENMVKDSKLESYAFADQFNPMTVTFQVVDLEFGSAGNLDIDFWVRVHMETQRNKK